MNSQSSYIAQNARTILKNHMKEQEDRKRAILHEQQIRELHQYETKLFHKQEELKRVKTELARLKAEAVVREKEFKNSIVTARQNNHINELENKIKLVDNAVKQKIEGVTEKIKQNKNLLEDKKRELLQYEQYAYSLQHKLKTASPNLTSKTQNSEHQTQERHQLLTRQLQEVSQKIQQNQSLFENKQKQIVIYQNQINEIQTKILALKKETDNLTQIGVTLSRQKDLVASALQKETGSKNNTAQNLKSKVVQEKVELDAKQKELKNAEAKIILLKKETDKLTQIHSTLSREKDQLISQTEQQKKTISSDIQRTQAALQVAQQHEQSEKRLFENTQKHIVGLEQALKTFTQDVLVLDNKLKALRTAMR